MHKVILLITIIFSSLTVSLVSAQNDDVFFSQLKTIFEAKKNLFADCTGKLTSQSEEEQIYECTLKLEGFTTTIVKGEFDVDFIARSNNYALAESNVKRLLNKVTREELGIVGYNNIDDKKDNPTLYKEFMTMISLYNKNAGSLNIQIGEKPSHLGFVIKIN